MVFFVDDFALPFFCNYDKNECNFLKLEFNTSAWTSFFQNHFWSSGRFRKDVVLPQKLMVFRLFDAPLLFSQTMVAASTFARYNVRRAPKRLLCGVEMFDRYSCVVYGHGTKFREGFNLHKIRRLLGSPKKGGEGEGAVAGVEDLTLSTSILGRPFPAAGPIHLYLPPV